MREEAGASGEADRWTGRREGSLDARCRTPPDRLRQPAG